MAAAFMASSPRSSVSLYALSPASAAQHDSHYGRVSSDEVLSLPLFPWEEPSARSTTAADDSASIKLPSVGNPGTSPTRSTSASTKRGTQTNHPERNQLLRWHIDWRSPFLMIFSSVAGILLAVTHHSFYTIMDGREVASRSQQEWSTRIGSGLAFLSQTAMATAVGQALTQQLWTDLKRKATDIKTIDSMFSITKDPTAFFNKSLLLHTKLIALLAAVAWLLPILAVVTPATLSVTLQNVTTIQTLNVPDVNWNASAFMDVFGREGDFTLVSVQVKRAITISAYSVEILAITPLFPDYSYSLNFFGPSFRCQDVNAPGEQALFESIRPSNYNQTIQNVLNNNGTPFMDTWDFAMDLLYVGIIPFPSAYNSILLLTPDVNISCTLWNTSYDVIFDLSQGAQTIHESKVIPQEPYRYDDIDDDFTYGMVGSMGFEAVAGSMASILKGHIEVADSMWPHFGAGGSNADFTNNTGVWDPIYHTGLIFCPELGEHIVQINIDDPSSMPQTLTATMPRWMCRAGSLARAVEELSRNITYSLFTVPDVVEERPIHANIRSARNEYSYRSRYLLLSYGIGILFTISGIAIGGFAYHSNGYSASTSFSTILLTTRKNPNLDELSEGQCLGKQPLAEEIGRIKLRFGVLSPAGSSGVEIGHAGFGLMGDTRRLRKYEYLR